MTEIDHRCHRPQVHRAAAFFNAVMGFPPACPFFRADLMIVVSQPKTYPIFTYEFRCGHPVRWYRTPTLL